MEGLRKEPTAMPPAKPAKKMSPYWMIVFATALVVFSFALGFVANERRWFNPYKAQDEANAQLPEDLDFASVEEVYDTLRYNFDGPLDVDELMDGLKQGLADASGDEYTDYFNVDQTQGFLDALNGSFEGIGAELGLENDLLVVVAPLSGFPAEQAGLRAGDVISKIDGEDSFGLSVEEAVIKIRGEAGTVVSLTIVRDGEELVVDITRATIVIPSVEYEVLDGNIGYIKVTRFAEDTISLAREAGEDLSRSGVNSVVLDLRNNGGGYVDAGVALASLWLESDQVVFDQRSGGRTTRTERASGTPFLKGIKTIVLINEGSASASEIVAGALKDNEVAQLVGIQSFGKGSVQRLENLTDGSTLKVTVARWFTPSGINIDEDGITPDIEVDLTQEDYDNDLDPQLDKALELLNSN